MTRDDAQTNDSARISIRLEVDLDAQPIGGMITPAGGQPSPFVGWLGLTAALAELGSREDPPTPEKIK